MTTLRKIEWHKEGDCMIETGHKPPSHGYPSMRRNKVESTIARFILVKKYGDKCNNLVARHTCDNLKCINPDHIILGTRAQNSQDMIDRKRSTFGERNKHAKLTSEQIISIRSDPRLHRLIAFDYGVSSGHISEIKSRKTWKHI